MIADGDGPVTHALHQRHPQHRLPDRGGIRGAVLRETRGNELPETAVSRPLQGEHNLLIL